MATAIVDNHVYILQTTIDSDKVNAEKNAYQFGATGGLISAAVFKLTMILASAVVVKKRGGILFLMRL